MRQRCNLRRGAAAVLAMTYLVLFSVLAVGFYAATNVSSQVSVTDQKVSLASLSAESGVEFVRYQMAQVVIPHGTPQTALFGTLYDQLSTNLGYTPNFAGKAIARVNGVIMLPSEGYVNLTSNGARFKATIEDLGQKVLVKVVGIGPDGNIARAVQVEYSLAERASQIFDYGVASKGKIYTQGNSRIRGATDPTKGSVLSTCTSDPTPVIIKGKEVSGDISITNPAGNVLVAGASIGGTSDPVVIYRDHVHKGVDEPEFPTIDTAAFRAYATNAYVPGQGTYINTFIPPNTNPNFAAGTTFQGVLYIQAPNSVTFTGHANIQGTIVTDDNPPGTVLSNMIDFAGDVSATGVETLPESFGDLRKLHRFVHPGAQFRPSVQGQLPHRRRQHRLQQAVHDRQRRRHHPRHRHERRRQRDGHQRHQRNHHRQHRHAELPGRRLLLQPLRPAARHLRGGPAMSVSAFICRKSVRGRRGMSIIEVLISLAIVAMLLTAVAAAFSSSAQIIETNDQFFRASQAARVSLNQILTEVRRSHAVSAPTSGRIDMMTFDMKDRSYVYDPAAKTLKLITNDITTDPDYTLASNVVSCVFAADTMVDKGGISHVVRVSVGLTVQVGTSQIRLNGSAAPRREQLN